jgi:uncharacterized protein YjiS (DUF1127 family)
MSAHLGDSQFSFRLPSLSYIDASWEEPELRAAKPVPARASVVRALIAAFRGWLRDNQAAAELGAMSDRELLDIGIGRADLQRVFDPAHSAELRYRGA